MNNEFKREVRYVVIKLKRLNSWQKENLFKLLGEAEIKTVECAVIEHDWPEYEPVWKMIEDRVTGKAALSQEAEPVEDMPEEGFLSAADESSRSHRRVYEPKPAASSQDVEEFIYTHGNSAAQFGDSRDVVPVDALTAWMAGHAMVPVEPTARMWTAGGKEIYNHKTVYGHSGNGDAAVLCYKAMLTASKERTE